MAPPSASTAQPAQFGTGVVERINHYLSENGKAGTIVIPFALGNSKSLTAARKGSNLPLVSRYYRILENENVAALLLGSLFLGKALAGLGAGWTSVGIGAVLVLGLAGLVAWRPAWLVRVLFWVIGHTVYRLTVFGRDNVPERGPALLVCNQVSYFDALLLFAAQKRQVRLVTWSLSRGVPVLRFLLWLARAIPIDSLAGPRAIAHGLRLASEALGRGEVVCLFGEGAVTQTGFELPFARSFEQVMNGKVVPVIPVCLDHIWGSLFSYPGGKFLWKWPLKVPYPVVVAFGPPLPAPVVAAAVRQGIQQLSASCAVARGNQRLPVHREFLRRAARHPFRPCLVDSLNKGKVYRYAEVLAGAGILAGMLHKRVGDVPMVGVWLPPSVGGAFVNIALSLLGKAPVNLNYTSSSAVVQSAVRQCGLRWIVTSRLFTSKVPLDAGADVELIYAEDFRKEVTTAQRLRAFLAILLLPAVLLERWVYRLGTHGPGDLGTIIFSSGSTGEPKGVLLSQRNLAANMESAIQAIDPRPSDRILGILPFFHSFGFTVTLWLPLQIGASVVYHADPRQAKEIGDLCRTYRCTIQLMTATFLRFCLRRCEPDDFKTLRILICGAEKLPPSLALEFKEKFGVLPLEGYGCTELSPVAASNLPDWEIGGARQIANKPGTIGRPLPGVAARIVQPDTFEPLPVGHDGLLLIYGANVMEGYLGRPDVTREVIRDGWYVTGDIARLDEDGFLTITDRQSRFSKIGGEMVPHQKIEDELHAILATAERACVVTAVPDEKRGERLVVLYTPLNGLDLSQLYQQLNNRGLPNLWIPAERDFFLISEVPLLGTGKVDLKKAKEIALEQRKG